MAMPLPADLLARGPYFSVDVLPRLPDDGNRYEVVYGELLVSPAPSAWHQELLRRLVKAIDRYLDDHPEALLVIAPADVQGGPDTLVQPDLFVIPKAVARTGAPRRLEHLLLVIEIASPATLHADRFQKRRRYQEAGVPTYWLVDPEKQGVDVWKPELAFPNVERSEVRWRAPGAAEELLLNLPTLFAPIA